MLHTADQVPAHRFMKVSDDGNVVIEPLGSELGTEQVIGKIALTLGTGEELKNSQMVKSDL